MIPFRSLAVLILIPLLQAQGQRPIIHTEDALTLGRGNFEFGLGAEFYQKHRAPSPEAPRSLWRLFVAAIHIGVAENVNFDLDWRGGLLGRLGTTRQVFDWGDLVVSTRINFLRERNGFPSVGLRTAVKLPNTPYTEHQLGTNQMDYHSNLLLSRHFSQVETRLNIGFSIVADPKAVGSQDDIYSFGAGAVVPLQEHVSTFIEVLGMSGYFENDAKLVSRFGVLARFGEMTIGVFGSIRIAGSNRDIATAFEYSEDWSIGLHMKNVFVFDFWQ